MACISNTFAVTSLIVNTSKRFGTSSLSGRKLADLDLVEYVPPFRGTELKILKRLDSNEVKLDFAALKYKLKHAYKKLDLMESYIYHNTCRQKYILDIC